MNTRELDLDSIHLDRGYHMSRAVDLYERMIEVGQQ